MTPERDVLPTNVKPTHYDLTITPDLSSFTFKGKVLISLSVSQPSKTVQLNANELEIKSAVYHSNGKKQEAKHSLKNEILTLEFHEEVASNGTLEIEYDGFINDKMAGFYRSGYEENGVQKFMAATQFEACDARRALPCWDEPAIKATFTVKLQVHKGLVALSNMNQVAQKNIGSDVIEVEFAKSPIMSTYLLAFIVGDLDYIESKTKNGTDVRVYAVKGQSHKGKFALEVGARTLEFFEQYFDCKYPLPKMDMVAIPDFAAGAMENWGLVTYRTVYVLFDEKGSSLKTKQNVAYVVGHELAHQWFGNLVTMEWWSDLWLNEGFATWVGWLAADHLFPEWNIWTQFLHDDLGEGLHLDCLKSSHAIQVPVKNPSEISQIFDSISYSKGASVIRMLVAYLGEDVFQKGMQKYLKKHQYKNAKTSDLWDSLSEASGKSVNEIMASWTEQVGFPLLTVNECNKHSKKCLCLRQNRYLAGAQVSAQDDKNLWHIPLGLNVDGTVHNDMLSSKDKEIELKGDFYKFNHQHTGFYRVKYPEGTVTKLGEAIKQGKLNASDRLGVISDAFALAQDGYYSSTVPLSLLEYFVNETDYLVWGELSSGISSIASTCWDQPEEFQQRLSALIRELVSPLAKRLGFEVNESDDDLTKLLRNLVLAMAGKSDDEWVLSEIKKRFKAFSLGDEKAIHPDLRASVFALAVKNGDYSVYESVFKIFKESQVADEKLAALAALGSTKDEALIKKTLDMALSGQVRNQDLVYIFRSVGGSRIGRKFAWPFLKQNFDVFHSKFYKASTALLGRLVSSTTDFSSEEHADDIEKFFKGRQVEAIQRTIDQSVEKIRTNSRWVKNDLPRVTAWLATKFK